LQLRSKSLERIRGAVRLCAIQMYLHLHLIYISR